MKYCIVDARLPRAAKESLRKDFELIDFCSRDIVYEAISGHPDIFMFQSDEHLIVAPNLPQKYFDFFDKAGIRYQKGSKHLGSKYPETAYYNVAAGDGIYIHKKGLSEPLIEKAMQNHKFIHSNQGYARCNTLILDRDHILTSDAGLHKLLPQSLLINPREIKLPGFINGFFGGCCGLHNKTLYLSGSLNQHSQGAQMGAYISEAGYRLVELYDGPLFDGGGIFFFEANGL